MRKLFFLLFSGWLFLGYSQITLQEKDSLIQLIANQSQEKNIHTIDYLIKNYYLLNELDSALYYIDSLNLLTKKNQNKPYAGNILYYKAERYAYLAKYDSAKYYLKKAILLHKKVKCRLCEAKDYNLLSLIYTKNNKPKDFEYGFRALKIFEEEKDALGMINSLTNLRLFYFERANYGRVKQFGKRITRLVNKHRHKIPLARQYELRANRYIPKTLDSALIFLKKAACENKKKLNRRKLSNIYFILGRIYSTEQPDSAIVYTKKSLDLSQKVFKPLTGSVFNVLSKLYYDEQDYYHAKKHAKQAAKTLLIENDWETIQNSMQVLYDIYKETNQPDSAFYFVDKMITYSDSMYKKKIESISMKMEAEYENEKNQLRIEKLSLERQKDKKIKSLLIGGLLLSLLVFSLFVRSYTLRRKKNILARQLLQTEKEKMEQDLKHKTRELTSQALMMLQKNKLLEDILNSLSIIKTHGDKTFKEINDLKRQLKRSMHSEKDWEVFRQYFEEINKDFFMKLKKLNEKITPSELKLAALIKLHFSIKESASLLHISEGSIKTARYQLRKKLGLKRHDNLYDFLNGI